MIAAEGEQKASRALREAANVIAESSSALQVSTKRPSEKLKLHLRKEVHFIPRHSLPHIKDEGKKRAEKSLIYTHVHSQEEEKTLPQGRLLKYLGARSGCHECLN